MPTNIQSQKYARQQSILLDSLSSSPILQTIIIELSCKSYTNAMLHLTDSKAKYSQLIMQIAINLRYINKIVK